MGGYVTIVLFSLCFLCFKVNANYDNSQNNEVVNSVIQHLNNSPQKNHTYLSGTLVNSNKVGDIFSIDINIEILCKNEPCLYNTLKCKGLIKNIDGNINVIDEGIKCDLPSIDLPNEVEFSVHSKIDDVDLSPVELAHEIQLNDQYVGSGEQFIAVRKDSNGGGDWCAGCPTDISVTADGVSELATQAVQHLNRHKPNERHNLNEILSVQRQAQIVNGVRYILLLKIDSTVCDNNSANNENGECKELTSTSICHVTILEKPWLKLSDGSKFRAVLFNNCTEEYNFGDEGEILSTNNGEDDPDIIKAVHNTNLQTQQKVFEEEITDEKLKEIQNQIITEDYGTTKTYSQISDKDPNHEDLITKKEFDEILSEPKESKLFENEDNNKGFSDNKKQALEGLSDLLNFGDPFVSNVERMPFQQVLKNRESIAPHKSSSEINKSSSSEESSEEKENIKKDNIDKNESVKRSKREINIFDSEGIDYNNLNILEEEENNIETPEEFDTVIRRRRSLYNNKNNILITEKKFIHDLAKFGLQTLDDFDSDSFKRVLLNVLDYKKTENSPNSIYVIKIEVGFTSCSESTENNKHCIVNKDKKNKICDLKILLKDDQSKKVSESHCYPVNKPEEREIGSNSKTFVGGLMSIQLPDRGISDLAELSVNHYDLTSTSENYHRIVKVVSASKQIVSGIKTKIIMEIQESDCPKNTIKKNCKYLEDSNNKFCTASIWEQPWLNKKEISIECKPVNFNLDDRHIKSTIQRNRRNIPGGFSPINLPNNNIDKLAEISIQHYDLTSSGENHHLIVKINSAEKQIVSGTNTKIEMEVKESDCPKNNVKKDCNYLTGSQSKLCNALIWEQPWLNKRHIKIDCIPSIGGRSTRSVEKNSLSKFALYDFHTKLYKAFIKKYNKIYLNEPTEYMKRFKIFNENLDIIYKLNKYELGTAQYGVTKYADLSQDEFRQRYLGLRPDLRNESIIMDNAEIPLFSGDIPTSFDWRDKGAVTPVKDQGQCGSCWAFSVTGNIEGQYKIKNGTLLSFSEQELVDCDKLDSGCNGGLPDNAYRAIEELGGLELENDYPYDAEDEKCHFIKSKVKVVVSSAVNISKNEDDILKWLLKNGPISIGINANAMQFYLGGISYPPKFLCNPKNLNHGVLIVGYGIHEYPLFKKAMPFWIVKNSWGGDWGEQGYYRVYRGDGTCGLNLMASSAII